MSCNIYEDPDQNMKVKYSKRVQDDGGERVEEVVDIYEGSDTYFGRPSAQDAGAQTTKHLDLQRIHYRNAALILGILCFLLFVGICVLLYLMVVSKQEASSSSESQSNQSNSSFLSEGGNQTEWQLLQVQCFYTSTEKKNWTESRSDCWRRGGDLVMMDDKKKHDVIKRIKLLGDSWIGLETRVIDWENEKNEWRWVDGSAPKYWAWGTGVSVHPEAESNVFIKSDGNWNKTRNGLKYWICEKTCRPSSPTCC